MNERSLKILIYRNLIHVHFNFSLIIFIYFRLMQSVITNVRRNDLAEPIKRVALERSKNQLSNQPLFSIYRDILFLAFTVLGRGNIDQSMLIFIKL